MEALRVLVDALLASDGLYEKTMPPGSFRAFMEHFRTCGFDLGMTEHDDGPLGSQLGNEQSSTRWENLFQEAEDHVIRSKLQSPLTPLPP